MKRQPFIKAALLFAVLALLVTGAGCARLQQRIEGTWVEQTEADTWQELIIEANDDGTFAFAARTCRQKDDGTTVTVGTGILGTLTKEEDCLIFKIGQVFDAADWQGSIQAQQERATTTTDGEAFRRWYSLAEDGLSLYSNESRIAVDGARLTGTFKKASDTH